MEEERKDAGSWLDEVEDGMQNENPLEGVA